MREYKIYKTSLGWSIYRKKQVGKMVMIQFLNGFGMWTPNKTAAKVYYHQDDALGDLSMMKVKDGKDTD